jgi:pimeloyl-ACP methyl ester carboxylesterase
MSEAVIESVQCMSPSGLHRMSYKEWGARDNPRVLICVHGVTRVGDDFDTLARNLSDRYRVICPDVVGRGRSERLADPRHYHIKQYVNDMVTLVARVSAHSRLETLDWFGTSMGGLIGMAYASLPGNPIGKLVLNDIGPTLDPVALARIGDYIGQDLRFASYEEAAGFVRQVSLSFGEHSEEQWDKLARDVLRQLDDGRWTRHHDLGMAQPFRASTMETAQADEQELWDAYDQIRCPTLVVRGELSDLLSRDTAMAMTQRGPHAELVELPNVGHAPTFIHDDQIAIARRFLVG